MWNTLWSISTKTSSCNCRCSVWLITHQENTELIKEGTLKRKKLSGILLEILTVVSIKFAVFWAVEQCSLVELCWRFESIYCLIFTLLP